MPVHHIDAGLDQSVREAHLVVVDVVAPVGAPMQGHDGDVACLFRRHHAISELDCAVIGEVADVGDARSVLAWQPNGVEHHWISARRPQ